MANASAHVVEAELELTEGVDPAAVGAAVTAELCGEWQHHGPCWWPHNNAIDEERAPACFRTLFVADESEVRAVRHRIEAALRGASGWRVLALRIGSVSDAEHELAARLLAGPRAAD
jgi:hypothetical protein